MRNFSKYINDAEHRQKRLYERTGNYYEYLKNPTKLYFKYLAEREAQRICNRPEICRIAESLKDYEGDCDKYTDLKRYIKMNLRRHYELGLHTEKQGLNILDIGCGAGFFSYLAKEFGHNPQGLDVPTVELFNILTEKFDIPRWECRIEPRKPISCNPERKRFDLIVAYAICFHKLNCYLWSGNDWKFFLRNIERNFAKHGTRMHLWFNNHPHGDFEDCLEKVCRTDYKIKFTHKTIDIYF